MKKIIDDVRQEFVLNLLNIVLLHIDSVYRQNDDWEGQITVWAVTETSRMKHLQNTVAWQSRALFCLPQAAGWDDTPSTLLVENQQAQNEYRY